MSQTSPENHVKKATYGTWHSAITTDLIVSDSISLDEARQSGDALYYIERRPLENGRCVIVKITAGEKLDILPAPFSARSRVHEYGGGSYCIHGESVFFINDSDQDIYLAKNRQIIRITSAADKRFADFSYDSERQWLFAICETHANSTVSNSIVCIDTRNGEITELESGNDFYASPRLNYSATQLCWQTWNHPNMPWDGNQLWLADVDSDGRLSNKLHIAGDNDVSVFQPQWSAEDVLYFISDDTGWWHIYRYNHSDPSARAEQLTRGDKEFGLPQWVFAQSTYALLNNNDIICCYQDKGKATLALLECPDHRHTSESELKTLHTEWQEYSSITADAGNIAFIAASSNSFPQLVSARLESTGSPSLSAVAVKTSCVLSVSPDYYSKARTIEFSNRRQQAVYANYYPPSNPGYHANAGDLPPLIVICHGGPTGQASIALDARKQFWTSRGFALLDVNYSGSTGYGRNYRSRLNGNWGILDVEDCCDAAAYAVSHKLAKRDQLIIRGSSAGGYTVLAALTFEQVFSAGASYYGISDLTCLASDTHKFESRYTDRLIGPYPEAREIYQERSPINRTEQLNCPVIFFQGIDDRVVPKQQAENMFDALDEKGLPVAAQYFEGEQHGFRKAETIKQSLQNELSFYQLVFGLRTKDEINFEGNIELRNI